MPASKKSAPRKTASKSAHAKTVAPTRKRLAVGFGIVIIVVGGALLTLNKPHHTTPVAVTPTTQAVPLRVTSIAPLSGATSVSYSAPISIQFSAAISSHWTTPVLTPAVPGKWHVVGTKTLVFQPTGFLVPSEVVHVSIPAGTGVGAVDGTTLASAFNSDFTVASGSITRLQQLLAELDYLPVAYVAPGADATTAAAVSTDTSPTAGNSGTTGSSGATGTSGTTGAGTPPVTTATEPTSTAMLLNEPTSEGLIPLAAQPGSLVWRFPNIPSQLSALWSTGGWDVVTQGAVMAFESEHNLAPDGEPGPAVWTALLQAVANRDITARPYHYLISTETLPESLYVWSEGKVIYSTRVNSGVTGATTPLGTWPVYLRYTSATMSGTNPDGTHYKDPGVPWISYFHGSDAVHGFPRSSYGFPQSVGCLEVPIANAALVYPMDPYGTLVTVTTGDLAPELQTATPPPYIVSGATTTTTAPTTTTTPAATTTTTPAAH